MESVKVLKAKGKLSPAQLAVYLLLKKNSNKELTAAEIAEKAEKKAGQVQPSIDKLVELGLIAKKKDKFVHEIQVLEILDKEIQNIVGDKEHTNRTANTNKVVYRGDVITFPNHPLSPERKRDGEMIGTATATTAHINEEGFFYVIMKKENKKKAAKKISNLTVVDPSVFPTSPEKLISLKTKASLKAPTVVSPVDIKEEGLVIMWFYAEHYTKGIISTKAMRAALKATKQKALEMDAYWCYKEACKHRVRFVPTMIILFDGKQIARSEVPLDTEKYTKLIEKGIAAESKAAEKVAKSKKVTKAIKENIAEEPKAEEPKAEEVKATEPKGTEPEAEKS